MKRKVVRNVAMFVALMLTTTTWAAENKNNGYAQSSVQFEAAMQAVEAARHAAAAAEAASRAATLAAEAARSALETVNSANRLREAQPQKTETRVSAAEDKRAQSVSRAPVQTNKNAEAISPVSGEAKQSYRGGYSDASGAPSTPRTASPTNGRQNNVNATAAANANAQRNYSPAAASGTQGAQASASASQQKQAANASAQRNYSSVAASGAQGTQASASASQQKQATANASAEETASPVIKVAKDSAEEKQIAKAEEKELRAKLQKEMTGYTPENIDHLVIRSRSERTVNARVAAAAQRLVNRGYIELPAGTESVESGMFTRKEMAVLTLDAIERLNAVDQNIISSLASRDEKFNARHAADKQAVDDVNFLTQELKKELQDLGMGMEKTAANTSMTSEADDHKKLEEQKYRIWGQLRYNYMANSGSKRYDWTQSRLRLRLYGEAALNEDWHLFGMWEQNRYHLPDKDWTHDWRLYVRGLTGATILTGGRFGYMLGEGNIYDSSITGVTAEFGSPVEYEAVAARTSEAKGNLFGLTARYPMKKSEAGAGYYHFGDDDWGMESRNIAMLYYNYFLTPRWTVGAMALASNLSDRDGRNQGFVVKAQYGDNDIWEPGRGNVVARYYYQPKGTYVMHTMSGLGGYMEGFKGLGLGYYYGLAKNVVLGIEYYDLTNLETGEKGRTIWTEVNYYF